jgi:WD40 repeat protein
MDVLSGIVRIRSNKDIGTGFVVSDDGLIVTCAHVLGSSMPEKTLVMFQATGEEQEATVLPDDWRNVGAEDVAFLRILGPLPDGVQPLPLGSSKGIEGHSMMSFGYPKTGEVERGRATGEILGWGPETETGQPLLQVHSSEIKEGFSGAPIWDKVRQRVVGMVVIAARLGDTAYATPTEMLRAVSPDLQIKDICPYRNLEAFTEEDAGFFHGRERVIEQLVDNLQNEPRFLAVFGASGSGKSSVVQAGLIPQLRNGALPGSDRWKIIVTRPTESSFQQDLAKLNQISAHVVFVIDQFEELFVAYEEETRAEVIIHLVHLLKDLPLVTLIIVMRDDFYSLFVQQEELATWLKRGLINVWPTIKPEEVEDIIREPAHALGWQFEDGLIEMIVRDVLETPTKARKKVGSGTMLPLLEFTLTQLWDRRQDSMLTRDAYRRIGGITGGLSQWAEEAYGRFEKRLQPLVRRVFTGLVHLGDEKQHIADGRRRRALSTLIHSDAEKADVSQIVERLVAERLLVASKDQESDQEVVEIIHDALLWEWASLKQWLEDDRQFLNWLQELEQRIMAWERTNPDHPTRRKKEKLLQGSDLKEALAWQSKKKKEYLNQEELAFIQASVKFHRRRIALGIVGGAGVAAVVAASGLVLVPGLGQTAYKWVRAQFLPYRVLASFVADGRRVYCVAWSPGDALRLASGGAAGLGHISSSAGQHIYTYRGHLQQNRPTGSPAISITTITWSPDGFRVASGSSDGSVHVWNSDSTNPSPPVIYQQHSGLIHAVAWSPVAGSQGIASSAGFDTMIHVWNATTGQTLASYSKHTGPVNALAWSPDGAFIASGSGQLPGKPGENAVHIWHVANGETRWILRGHSSHILTVAWSPDGRSIASGGWDHTVKIWSVQTGKLLYTYTGHTNAKVNAVSWSPDSTYIVSAGDDGLVQVWRAQDGKQFYTYWEHTQAVNSVAWSPRAGDTRITSASNDTTVQIWQQK